MFITLQDVKDTLRQTQSDDDALLNRLINSAENEALRFLNRSQLPTLPLEYPEFSSNDEVISEEVPSSEDPVAPDVYNAVILLVQADYDGDPLKREEYRHAAFSLLQPYRIGLGM
jgi:hypothetical protein